MARTHRSRENYDHTMTVGEVRDIELRADAHPAIGYLNLTADDSKVNDVTILERRESDGHRATHTPDEMAAKTVTYRFEAGAPGLYRLRLKLALKSDERLLTPPVTVWVGRP